MLPSPFERTPTAASIEPLLPTAAARQRQKELGCSSDDMQTAGLLIRYHSVLPVSIMTEVPCGIKQSQHGLVVRSPSSPSSFVTQSEMSKFGLTPLIEAAERVLSSTDKTRPPLHAYSSTAKRKLPQTLPSIMQAMSGYPLGTPPMPKRSRIGSIAGLNVQASYSLFDHMSVRAMICPCASQRHAQHFPYQQVSDQLANPHVLDTSMLSPNSAETKSLGAREPAYMGSSVWEVVLATDMFPTSICLSEDGSVGAVSPTAPFTIDSGSKNVADAAANRAVKQSRFFVDEDKYASAPNQAVKKEELLLPPKVSIQTFADDSLQCKTMRTGEKFPCLTPTSCDPLNEENTQVILRGEPFNPLSLRSIINNEPTASPSCDGSNLPENIAGPNLVGQGPKYRVPTKPTHRVLKRSDYSQHGLVRSGRWSLEEEIYAKAMIEAFKSGYLPLHGNTSLRKFLSEVLVCHPMRISKKFVGYVRKYHWYRIAAGKRDPKVKRHALCELSRLERVFWMSLQQNSDWPSGSRHVD